MLYSSGASPDEITLNEMYDYNKCGFAAVFLSSIVDVFMMFMR